MAGGEGLGLLAIHAVPGEGGRGVLGTVGWGEVEGGVAVGSGGIPLCFAEPSGGRARWVDRWEKSGTLDCGLRLRYGNARNSDISPTCD